MIKTFLKHWIYEICIIQFFEAFTRNFKMSSVIENVKVGDRFKCLIIKNKFITIRYYDLEIVEVKKEKFTIKGLKFEEESCDSDEVSSGGSYKVDIFKYDEMQKYLE